MRFKIASAIALSVAVSVPQVASAKMPACSPRSVVSDKAINMAKYSGSLVYVDFWASWCGPCRKSFAFMNKLRGRYSSSQLKILAISVDEDRADAAAFLRKTPISVDVAIDNKGRCPKAYGVRAMPSSYIVAPNGEVIYEHVGFRSKDVAELDAKIAAAVRKYGK